MQAIPMAGAAIQSGAQNNMNNGQGAGQAYADPGNFFGGNSAQAMDPIGYGVFNGLGIKNWDPLVAATNRIPAFHGNPTSGSAPSAFPNLGPASLIPQAPQGAFGAIHNGTGPYNNMAAIGAGNKTFNPQGAKPTQGHPMMPNPTYSPMMAKPTTPINVGKKRP